MTIPTTLFLQRGSRVGGETFPPDDPYQLMVEHFADVLDGVTPIAYPAQEVIQTLSILDTVRACW